MTIAPSVLSGLPDPVFGVLTTNPNFTSIVKTALAHAPGRLASRLGYRGFTITLYRGGKYIRSHDIELHVNAPTPNEHTKTSSKHTSTQPQATSVISKLHYVIDRR